MLICCAHKMDHVSGISPKSSAARWRLGDARLISAWSMGKKWFLIEQNICLQCFYIHIFFNQTWDDWYDQHVFRIGLNSPVARDFRCLWGWWSADAWDRWVWRPSDLRCCDEPHGDWSDHWFSPQSGYSRFHTETTGRFSRKAWFLLPGLMNFPVFDFLDPQVFFLDMSWHVHNLI